MKILAFSDFHGLFGFVNHYIEVKKKIKQYQPDLLVLCGDLQDGGSLSLLTNRIRNLNFLNILFVWGNSEQQLDLSQELRFAFNIHLKIKTLNGFNFMGLGGDEFDMKRHIPSIRNILLATPKIQPLIIISHVPPFNTVDLCNDGRNVGVPEFRELIIEYKPLLVVCGHIHEQAHKSVQIGSALIVNVGTKGVLFNIDNDKITTVLFD